MNAFFLAAAGAASVVSAAHLDRMRFAAFRQRREIEEARDNLRQLDRAKSTFTANVHHELRTPLTLLLAPLEALLSGSFGEISERVRLEVRTMRANALRLLKLINDLLELARVENHGRQLRRRRLDLGECARRFVAEAEGLARRKELTISTRGLDDLPIIYADTDAVDRVVANLLGNAVKFTPPGGQIEISGARVEDGVLLEVADTGIGIPSDQLERVFDRFAQVDVSATRTHEGTGIGLSLAKELVELHSGWIRAESLGIGQGTRMQVWLPIGDPFQAESDEEVPAIAGESAGGAAQRGQTLEHELGDVAEPARLIEASQAVSRWEDARGSRTAEAVADRSGPEGAPEVLVVEDNAEMRRLLAHLLSQEFRVREARNGREALDAVRERAPDLVLTDVMMPEVSGTELCRALKGSPETSSLPVVLVTSKAEREMKVQGLELGADDYVTKPFHPRELLARVRSLVRLRRLQAQLEERNRALEEANIQLARTLEDLKAAEVQLVQAERLAAVGELAAGVAHEVNNPVNFALNAVRMLNVHIERLALAVVGTGSVNLQNPAGPQGPGEEAERRHQGLETEELAHEVAELVGIATEGLERTQRLVGDLKDFAGPQRVAHTLVDLERCLRSTVQLLGHSLQRAGIRVDMQIEGNLPRVHGDAGALNQVFLNLLKNAGEALETRGGRIGVEARREGATVVVEIRDDGPGVAAEVHARLFEPFVSTKDAGRGTGLGLSISHRIVTEHGGTLELKSEPGEGAVFAIRLPAEERDAP